MSQHTPQEGIGHQQKGRFFFLGRLIFPERTIKAGRSRFLLVPNPNLNDRMDLRDDNASAKYIPPLNAGVGNDVLA